jgi:hypothetical protein
VRTSQTEILSNAKERAEKGGAGGRSQDVIDCIVVKVFAVDARLKDRKTKLTSKNI